MTIRDAILKGDQAALLAELTHLPKRPSAPDPRTDDDLPPIPGESFDDVTVAWIAGKLTDDQYQQAIDAAASSDAK